MLRRHRGHAKEMAYLIERPKKQAMRAQAIIARRPPREVPHSPPPPKPVPFWADFQKKWFGPPDTFGLLNKFIPKDAKVANDNPNPFSNGNAFCKRLEKKGWKLLGSGCHSRVLVKGDSKKVIKVGCSADNWMRYVLWGRNHGYEGNFVPRVYSYKYFKGKSPFYVAVVERMERTTSEAAREDKDGILLELFPRAKHNEYARSALNMLQPGCGDFAEKLFKAANDNNWSRDTHGGNFMVRKDGSWVATDPINAHGDTPTERIRSRAV